MNAATLLCFRCINLAKQRPSGRTVSLGLTQSPNSSYITGSLTVLPNAYDKHYWWHLLGDDVTPATQQIHPYIRRGTEYLDSMTHGPCHGMTGLPRQGVRTAQPSPAIRYASPAIRTT
jgi:hypothetical protein